VVNPMHVICIMLVVIPEASASHLKVQVWTICRSPVLYPGLMLTDFINQATEQTEVCVTE
jgi:hypothetical protein